jgi:hypothetical protein
MSIVVITSWDFRRSIYNCEPGAQMYITIGPHLKRGIAVCAFQKHAKTNHRY